MVNAVNAGERAALVVLAVLLVAGGASGTIQVHVYSPLHVEYNVIGRTIILHIDTNYVVPNHKYSATAEIAKDPDCAGCYTVYVVLHTPATPGYAWNPMKLPAITAVIHPRGEEQNINIRVVPAGPLRNAGGRVEEGVRCAEIAAEVIRLRAEKAVCENVGCSEGEWNALERYAKELMEKSTIMRCGVAVPHIVRTEKRGSGDEILKKYITNDSNIVYVREQGDTTEITAARDEKILGIFPVSVRTEIIIKDGRVQIKEPLWYVLLRWLTW